MRTVLALISYLVSYTTYLYCMANFTMQESTRRLWNYYTIGLFLVFIFIRESQRYIPVLERELLSLSKVVIVLTILVIILHYHLMILNVYYMMGVIDIGTLIATIMIVIPAIRHEIFNIK